MGIRRRNVVTTRDFGCSSGEFLHENAKFEPGERCARAGISASAVEEDLLRISIEPKLIRIAKHRFVSVGRSPEHRDALVSADELAADFDRTRGHATVGNKGRMHP